jgi:hypothetical protein
MADEVIEALNRSAKLFVDRGEVGTIEEATAKLRAFRIHLFIGPAAAASATHQATLLTAVNCGRRTFLGGVTVSGALDTRLAVAVTPGETLGDAVKALQGEVLAHVPSDAPFVSIGPPPERAANGFAVRTTFDGWRAGVVPLGGPALPEKQEFTAAGVLAGALAVAEVFAHLDGDQMAGYRAVGLSLWDQSASADWTSASADELPPTALPRDLWIIGLGHLGQAFLWTLGLLPYAAPSEVRLFLQDVDVAGDSTESTSVLTTGADRGRLKTRICAGWAEARGFQTRLVERRFEADLRVADDEPLLALCGVDNPEARSILEGAGFATIFEAGLGSGVEDFRLIRTHSFPAPMSAAEAWARSFDDGACAAPAEPPAAYLNLKDRGELDECGLTRLAEVAVGAPFVGMVAAAVLIAQTVRMIADGARPTVLNLDLRSLPHRRHVALNKPDIVLFGVTQSA